MQATPTTNSVIQKCRFQLNGFRPKTSVSRLCRASHTISGNDRMNEIPNPTRATSIGIAMYEFFTGKLRIKLPSTSLRNVRYLCNDAALGQQHLAAPLEQH